MNGLQYAERIASHQLPSPPVARLIGFEVVSIEPGRAVIGLDASARHSNPMGTLHGGILGDIADAAMGMAYATGLAVGEAFTTLELKINFLRPVWNARLTATGTVKQRGNTVGLVECDVTDERGRLVAHASSTCLTLRGEKADGRRVTAEGSAPDPATALIPNTLDLTTSLR
jgi:uncharacterized protein (TIGR00369 family)